MYKETNLWFIFVALAVTKFYLDDEVVTLSAKDFAPEPARLEGLFLEQSLDGQPNSDRLLATETDAGLLEVVAMFQKVRQRRIRIVVHLRLSSVISLFDHIVISGKFVRRIVPDKTQDFMIIT